VERISNIGYVLRALVLICGFLAITISSFDDALLERLEDDLQRIEVRSEEDHQEQNHEIIYLPDFLATISSLQFHVDQIQSILFDIPFFPEIKCWHEIVLEYRGISFFKVLFQHIIAPNAP
jgi:hypothetical protein